MIHEAGNPGPSWDLAFRIINFLSLAAILYFLLRKPVKEFFAKRQAVLKAAVDEARSAHEASQAQAKEMEERLKNLERESGEMLRTFREEAASERAQILKDARAYTERLKGDVKKIADTELKRAKEELRGIAVDLARKSAEDLIRGELKKEDEERLTKNYLNQLKQIH